MPRQTTLKGLQSIIRHNIKKFLDKQKLTKKEYNEVIKLAEEYLNNASQEDLKQKGIVQKIINGGMKRSNEGDENEDENPRKRSFGKKIVDYAIKGKPFDDNENAVFENTEDLAKLIEDEKKAKQKYEQTRIQTEEAKKREELARTEYELIQRRKTATLERSNRLITHNQPLTKSIIDEHKTMMSKLMNLDTKHNAPNWVSKRRELIHKLLANDETYFLNTGNHFEGINDVRSRLQNAYHESSSSSSSSSSAPQFESLEQLRKRQNDRIQHLTGQ